jgi:hypothetical protein
VTGSAVKTQGAGRCRPAVVHCEHAVPNGSSASSQEPATSALDTTPPNAIPHHDSPSHLRHQAPQIRAPVASWNTT